MAKDFTATSVPLSIQKRLQQLCSPQVRNNAVIAFFDSLPDRLLNSLRHCLPALLRSTRLGLLAALLSSCASMAPAPPAPPPSLPGVPNQPNQSPAVSSFPEAEQTQLRALLVAMRDLLNTSPDIARTQFARKQPAVNAAQDRRWLGIADQLAVLQKLPVDQTRVFMQAQLDASNFAKRGLFAQWESAPSKLPLKPSIHAQAEARIGELIKRFARAQPALKIPGAKAAIETIALEELPNRNPLSEPTRKLAIGALLKMAAP